MNNILYVEDDLSLIDGFTEKKRHWKAVFQDCFSCTAADLLCMAGESAT